MQFGSGNNLSIVAGKRKKVKVPFQSFGWRAETCQGSAGS
jgi:hypothetical protein